MHSNAAIIDTFYQAFQHRDHAAMAACYAPDVRFEDPVFTLEGARAGAMWRMLCERGKDLRIQHTNVHADDQAGSADWTAWYTFSATGRPVVNRIHATFAFSGGRITRHSDSFDLHRWAAQALGLKGRLLGWTPFVQRAIRRNAGRALESFMRSHAEEWGVPVRDDRALFECLTLEGAQAGLSWSLILARRDHYRRAFAGFDPVRVARFTPARVAKLVLDPGIVRHRGKIASTVSNARALLEVQREAGAFAGYVWGFTDAATMSRELKRRGFRFVGPTICYAFMQAVGMVNDHEPACFRRAPVERLRERLQL
jgi:DNA-3-methyladenine glycosylase I